MNSVILFSIGFSAIRQYRALIFLTVVESLWGWKEATGCLWLNLLLIPIAIAAFKRKLYAIIFIPVVLIWLILAYTGGHQVLIVYMGHGMELLMAGIFLYRATTGVALEREYERPIYSTLAFYLIIDNIIFSINLISNQAFRYLYENDVRQLVNDFKHIAFFNLGNADVSVVASFHLLMCAVTVGSAVFCIRFVRWHC